MVYKEKDIERFLIRILLIFLLVVAFSPIALASSGKKFDFLLRFFDMNEAAFAYHRHCLSAQDGINKTFLNTMELVADELFAEGIQNNPSMKPEQVKTKILERRYKLQYNLDNSNMREGCLSKDSSMARTHYEEFSRFDKTQIEEFISKETNPAQ